MGVPLVYIAVAFTIPPTSRVKPGFVFWNPMFPLLSMVSASVSPPLPTTILSALFVEDVPVVAVLDCKVRISFASIPPTSVCPPVLPDP